MDQRADANVRDLVRRSPTNINTVKIGIRISTRKRRDLTPKIAKKATNLRKNWKIRKKK